MLEKKLEEILKNGGITYIAKAKKDTFRIIPNDPSYIDPNPWIKDNYYKITVIKETGGLYGNDTIITNHSYLPYVELSNYFYSPQEMRKLKLNKLKMINE